MPTTLLLDVSTWDLVVDAKGNIALASEPYALAQDAASACKTFLGECYWDTTVGVPLQQEILGHAPSVSLLKQRMVAAARTVPGVQSARFFLTAIDQRGLSGQLQVASDAGNSVVDFSVINPQG